MPGAQVIPVRRSSATYPAPTLDSMGRPVDWTPTAEDHSVLGELWVFIDEENVTFYRGIPIEIIGWSNGEPFGSRSCELAFPQISPFEAFPVWLHDWASIFILLLQGETWRTLFDGVLASVQTHHDEQTSRVHVTGIGYLYHADLYLMPPELTKHEPIDVANAIARELDPVRRPNLRTFPVFTPEPTQVKARPAGGWEPLVTGYLQGLLDQAQHTFPPGWHPPVDQPPFVPPDDISQPGGTVTYYGSNGIGWSTTPNWWLQEWHTQYTLLMQETFIVGPRPVVQPKNMTTVAAIYRTGQPGLDVELFRDPTQEPTVVFGEGTDPESCAWRNAKWPNVRPDTAPVFGGTPINVGDTSNDMLLFEREMQARGWPGFVTDGFYSSEESRLVRQFQAYAGLTVDGVIGASTWAAAFAVGSNAGDLDGAYIAPLGSHTEVEPNLYDPAGAITGPNPAFDAAATHVERYENFGPRITKGEAVESALRELQLSRDPGWYGTLRLRVDPEVGSPEVSRFLLHAFRNVLLRGWHGQDVILHIVAMDVDWPAQTVTLTVDSKARDRLTVAAMLKRDREATDPARRKTVIYRNASRTPEDRMAVFDCESSAGIVPYHAIAAGQWNVLRIPFGQAGTVVRTELSTDTPVAFVAGVFDREVTPTQMADVGDPFFHFDYWDRFPAPGVPLGSPGVVGPEGLIVAWGDVDEPGGYSPGRLSDNGPVTGLLVDNASWYYESSVPPWLWVAIFTDPGGSATFIRGRCYTSSEAG